MENEKTSLFSNGLIWFGAAISIAEILTGTYIAPLGLYKGGIAIIIGHIIGFFLLYLAGLIGSKTEKNSMETVTLSFGKKGAVVFSVLNVLQLVGWTAIMIVNGANAANSVFVLKSPIIWSIIIGALILFWIIIGIKNLEKVNIVAIGALFILTIIMSMVVFGENSSNILSDEITFSAAVELSVAMPLSWLPLISDYTKNAKNKNLASPLSSLVYSIGSSWMYFIGLGAALYAGEGGDIAKIMLASGKGVAGLIVVVFSTVTTTFLDAYSGGVSSTTVFKKISEKKAAIVVCIVGIILAISMPVNKFESFLYLIGSVFAPMIAILATDYFILRKNVSDKSFDLTNTILWIIGFALYRIMMNINTPLGSTFPVMLIIGILCIAINKILIKE